MKRLKLIFVGTIFILTSCGNNLEVDSLRSIDQGELIGLNGENNTYTWKGIPFAKPPVNNLRWKATQEANSWSGRLEATDFKQACFQRGSVFENNDSEWSGNEDCLYLNIWTPKLSKEQIEQSQDKLPVMMWIHGGANVVGSAHTYDPSSLVSNHNVIVVTIQYRMGPLGWFRHPALHNDDSSLEDRSGNYGTLDTIMALRWINKNIHHFGGDPNNVTVFGESAGGHNSAAIFASPLAQGLFHKVIVESGIMSVSSIKAAESYLPEDGIAPTVSGLEIFNHLLIQDGKANSIKDAKETQLSMTREEIRDFFYAQPPEALMKAMNDAGPKRDGMTRVFPDGLVILSGGIKEAFNNSKFNRVPIITGTNKDENKFFNSMNRNFVEWGPATGLYKTAGIEEMPLKIIDLDLIKNTKNFFLKLINLIKRLSSSVQIYYGGGNEFFEYDKVVLATHADQALSLIDEPLKDEKEILSNFNYRENLAVIHTDEEVMPKNKYVWSSWNSCLDKKNTEKNSLTYWLNLLQNLKCKQNIFLTLNPFMKISEEKILKKVKFTHPYFDQNSLDNQKKLYALQNKKNILFCGSYFGYGFHEDGIKSSINMIKSLND